VSQRLSSIALASCSKCILFQLRAACSCDVKAEPLYRLTADEKILVRGTVSGDNHGNLHVPLQNWPSRMKQRCAKIAREISGQHALTPPDCALLAPGDTNVFIGLSATDANLGPATSSMRSRTANLQLGIAPPRIATLEQPEVGVFRFKTYSVGAAYVSYRVLESRCIQPQQYRRPNASSNSVSNWTRRHRCQLADDYTPSDDRGGHASANQLNVAAGVVRLILSGVICENCE